jgi:succinate dehydrogenase/fumarate reductase flavoprotein subunit
MINYTKKEYSTDVLVIGGGIAAVFAATRALENGAKVMMIDKGSVGRSGQSPFASAFALYDPDSTGERASGERSEWHRMMNENGKGVNNSAYLDKFMDYSKGVYDELTEWGATDVGFGGVLRTQIQSRDVELLERTMMTNLLKENGKVVGATGFSLDREEAVVVKAKAVILCTGAGGFKPNGFQVRSLTFDGDAMAYRIGAKISGKEYTDGHFNFEDTPAYCWGQWSGMWERGLPSITEGPMDGGGNALAITDSIQVHENGVSSSSDMQSGPPKGEEGEESDKQSGPPKGEEGEASDKQSGPPEGSEGEAVVEGQATTEGGKGGPPSGGGPGGRSMSNRIGGASAGLSVHKAEGLFPADNQCRSNIEGLFAAGDSLSSMLVGAIYNGVGGFAFAGSAAQGAQAGEVAASYVKDLSEQSVSDSTINTALEDMFEPLNNEQGYSPSWVEHLLQGVLTPYYVLYVKSEDRLNSALTNIEFYRDHFAVKLRADDLHDLRKAHEVKNMILNAEMKLRSSLFRTESRGNHYREDYPDRNDDDWLAWVVLQKGDDETMNVEKFYIKDFAALCV